MQLPEEAIEEFERVYYEEYDKRLSDQETLIIIKNLIEIFKIVYKPVLNNQLREDKKYG